jgi:hypothetical protein
MRALLRILIAAIYLVAATTAQAGFLINSYAVAPGTPIASITFLQCAESTSDLTTYTLATQNVGTASADRYTIGTISSTDSVGTYTTSTVTVGGDSATINVDQGASSPFSAVIFAVANPAGTSEDVVITFSEAITGVRLCLWQANNITSATAVATTSATAGSGGPITLSINVSSLGVAVGVCSINNTTPTYVWTGLTEREDSTGTEFNLSAADFTNDNSADSPLAITCDPTGSNTNVGASASYL